MGQLPAFEIREVYYLDGKTGWTERPASPHGETVEDLKADIDLMQQAFDRPVLDITDEDNPYEVTDDASE